VDASSLLAITARLEASDAFVKATCSSAASRRTSTSRVSTGIEPVQAVPAAAVSTRASDNAALQQDHIERSSFHNLPPGTRESTEEFLKMS
jgi:hypothetical protein